MHFYIGKNASSFHAFFGILKLCRSNRSFVFFVRSFGCALFILRGIILKSIDKESNFVKTLKVMDERWLAALDEEMQLIEKTAFLCGSVSDNFLRKTDATTVRNTVETILQNNSIKRVFYCSRNKFDEMIVTTLFGNAFDGVEIVLIADKYDTGNHPLFNNHPKIKTLKPFDERIERKKLYNTLYRYAIYNSKYMITGYKYDDDISAYIKEIAEQKNTTIIDIYEYL